MLRTTDGEQLFYALTRKNAIVVFQDHEHTVRYKHGSMSDTFELCFNGKSVYTIYDLDLDTARFDQEEGAFVLEGNRILKVKTKDVSVLTWKELRDLIDTIPEEDLGNSVVVNDHGSETFVSELVLTDSSLYLCGF